MKSAISLPAPPAAKLRTYPYLGRLRDSELVVLFQSPKAGIVVSAGGRWPLSFSCTTWEEGQFRPFDGTVTLSND